MCHITHLEACNDFDLFNRSFKTPVHAYRECLVGGFLFGVYMKNRKSFKWPIEYLVKCPKCDGDLRLKPGRFGIFYGCENYFKTGCSGSELADDDGKPIKKKEIHANK
jgi:hypothetical protein